MLLVQDDQLVQTFSAWRLDEPLDDRIRPRGWLGWMG
jgi:hypothetical protein